VLVPIDGDCPGVAVGLARVINEARRIAAERSVHDTIVVQAEHVRAKSFVVIFEFPAPEHMRIRIRRNTKTPASQYLRSATF